MSHKYEILNFVLTDEDSPATWTKEELDIRINHKKIIGYIFKPAKTKFNSMGLILNIYVIDNTPDNLNIVTFDYNDLLLDFYKFIKLREVQFKNPPLDIWIESKDNWIKKQASKLAKSFDRPFDEMLSIVYLAITKVYAKPHVYIGCLNYIERAAYNEVLMEMRTDKHLLNGNHELVISLDQTTNIDNDKETTIHEIIGKDDVYYNEEEYNCLESKIRNSLSFTFSVREIDQIINNCGQLPNLLYRKLLRWRKYHNKEDFYE